MDLMCPASCSEVLAFEDNCVAWDDENCNDDYCNLRAHKGDCAADP